MTLHTECNLQICLTFCQKQNWWETSTAGLVSSWLQFRHKAAPIMSLLFSVSYGRNHQAFVSAEVPPPWWLYYESAALERQAINKDDQHFSCLFWIEDFYCQMLFFFLFFLLLMNTYRQDKTDSVIVYWICLSAGMKTHSGGHLRLKHISFALFYF